jgi:hypothetical protein
MNEPVSLIADLLALLDVERRYEFEERAGIIEFDANVPRDQAEAYALIDLLRTHPDALVGLAVLQVAIDDRVHFVLTSDVAAARGRFEAMTLTAMRIADLAEVVKQQFDGLALLERFE